MRLVAIRAWQGKFGFGNSIRLRLSGWIVLFGFGSVPACATRNLRRHFLILKILHTFNIGAGLTSYYARTASSLYRYLKAQLPCILTLYFSANFFERQIMFCCISSALHLSLQGNSCNILLLFRLAIWQGSTFILGHSLPGESDIFYSPTLAQKVPWHYVLPNNSNFTLRVECNWKFGQAFPFQFRYWLSFWNSRPCLP